MNRPYATLLGLLIVFVALFFSPEGTHSAAVPLSTGIQRDPSGPLKMILMKESEASNFFRRRSRRALKSQDEINGWRFIQPMMLSIKAEQMQILAADERKREFQEQKRSRYESHAEEEHDEQDERTRESTEQWREFHYDGMYPPQEYTRHHI